MVGFGEFVGFVDIGVWGLYNGDFCFHFGVIVEKGVWYDSVGT